MAGELLEFLQFLDLAEPTLALPFALPFDLPFALLAPERNHFRF